MSFPRCHGCGRLHPGWDAQLHFPGCPVQREEMFAKAAASYDKAAAATENTDFYCDTCDDYFDLDQADHHQD